MPYKKKYCQTCSRRVYGDYWLHNKKNLCVACYDKEVNEEFIKEHNKRHITKHKL